MRKQIIKKGTAKIVVENIIRDEKIDDALGKYYLDLIGDLK